MKIKTDNYEIYNGDCLEVMDMLITKGIKVDCILTDPPYGTTACKWDTIIPFEEMWGRLNKLIKNNSAIILFGSQPFTSALISSNIKCFKYELIWDKTFGRQPHLANIQPMKQHENILIFSIDGKRINYYPQKIELPKPYYSSGASNNSGSNNHHKLGLKKQSKIYTHKTPTSLFSYKPVSNTKTVHPTQKPVALLEYLIKTYTLEGETVLDFTMGSGSTGVACLNTNRKFIGIELDENYFNIAKNRIEKTERDGFQ